MDRPKFEIAMYAGTLRLAALVGSLCLAGPAWADAQADQELGKKYVYCGQLILGIESAGSADSSAEDARTGLVMTALGGMLLGARTLAELQPHIDAATSAMNEEAQKPNAQDTMLDNYAGCVKLNNERSSALLERFKDQFPHHAAP